MTISDIATPVLPKVESEKSLVDKYGEYKDHPAIPAMPQSTIYDIIIDTVYSSEISQLQWPPSGWLKRVFYLIRLPLVVT